MVLVRDAVDGDFADIQAIYAEHVLHSIATFEEIPPSVEEMRNRHRAIIDSGLPYLVAEVDGIVTGYCYAALYRARSAYRFTIEDSIYIRRGQVGGGIGTALLSELISRCEQGPWRQMLAVIGDSGNAASLGLHRKMGFTHAGALKSVGFKHGRWIDTVLLQRPLNAGDGSLPE